MSVHQPYEVCDCPNPRAPRPYHCAAVKSCAYRDSMDCVLAAEPGDIYCPAHREVVSSVGLNYDVESDRYVDSDGIEPDWQARRRRIVES